MEVNLNLCDDLRDVPEGRVRLSVGMTIDVLESYCAAFLTRVSDETLLRNLAVQREEGKERTLTESRIMLSEALTALIRAGVRAEQKTRRRLEEP